MSRETDSGRLGGGPDWTKMRTVRSTASLRHAACHPRRQLDPCEAHRINAAAAWQQAPDKRIEELQGLKDEAMQIERIDHVALHVADVAVSCRFYESILGLPPLPRPAFDFPGAWFRLGEQQELHLIGGRSHDIQSHNRGTHFALRVADLDAWERHLSAMGARFLPRKLRPDGATQIFVIDPDGHYIELCRPAARA